MTIEDDAGACSVVLPVARPAAGLVGDLVDDLSPWLGDDRGKLDEMARDLSLGFSPATQKAWASDWAVWSAYCAAVGVPRLPATDDSLRKFLEAAAAAGRKRATLEHYVSTLAFIHRLAELPWPLDEAPARLMWRGIRASFKDQTQRQARGLVWADIQTIVATLDLNDLRDLRDAALLSVAYETMCRRSEIVAADIEHVTWKANGSGLLRVTRSKTDKEGIGVSLYLSTSTVGLLRQWIALAGLDAGPLFRSVPRWRPKTQGEGDNPDARRLARRLTDRDLARMYKKRAAAAGIPPEFVSGHSTRIGAAQDLVAANFSGAAVMQQGRWKSERTFARYIEGLEAERGAMALLRSRQS